ncbi:MAG TPA: hypothetical protein VK203_00305 [Nostocaceae cyanobacterium]|nr:hypothetical protein [Nostocaceae cyanobacterium]
MYKLSKRYRKIRDDIEPIILQLQQGEITGDRLVGLGEEYQVYKVRIKNSDLLQTSTNIILLTIYSKSDQDDIAVTDIRFIIEQTME